MTTLNDSIRHVARASERALAGARPWVMFMARAGYAAKGVVYCVIGALALPVALGGGGGGKTTGFAGAIANLVRGPGGVAIAGVLAVAFAGYGLWCVLQALIDPERAGTGRRGVARRAVWFLEGAVFLSAVGVAVRIAARGGAGGDTADESAMTGWAARLMSMPAAGPWLVGLIGGGVAAFGLWQIVAGWRVDLDDQLSLGRLSPRARWLIVHVCRFGIAARGVVFAVIGGAAVAAAFHVDPREAKGIGGALWALARQRPYGQLGLGVVALGMVAYGFYEFVRARYRRIRTPGA